MKRNISGKLIPVTLAGILALSLTACAGTSGTGSTSGSSSQETPQEETAVEETEDISETPLDEYADEYYYTGEEAYYDAEADTEPLLGGWEKTDSPVVTDEMKALTEKASAGLSGARYTPVAYLGHQLVSGTNHLLLCRTASTVDPNAAETYMFVTIYEDLKGNAQITSVVDTGIPTNIADLDGGWSAAESPVITKEVEDLCDKAFQKLVGVGYKPVALLSTQVVAGTNYCVLCESTIVYPGAETTYAFVTIYEDLEGNAKVLDIQNCDEDGAVTGATIAE